MSGTSLDGLDIVFVEFEQNPDISFKIRASKTYSYPKEWYEKLKTGISQTKEDLMILDVDYGRILGGFVNSFIEEFQLEETDFIASHGHTIFHQPKKGFTLQIGDGQTLANETKVKVVCDFRTQDVKLGGQGAPLVPIGDRILFGDYDYCLNLGGFSNVSFENDKKERIAFDICPVNIVLNQLANQLNLPFDEDGKLAAQGQMNTNLLNELNDLDFYRQSPPKSLGLEWVKSVVFPILEKYEIPIKSKLRTFVEHIAFQIGNTFKSDAKVLASGGGVRNDFLMERIEHYSQSTIEVPSEEIIDFKEALVFALLGLLRIENHVNCLRSVTGAQKDHSSGEIYEPVMS